jgi:transcription antitermination factor NusG
MLVLLNDDGVPQNPEYEVVRCLFCLTGREQLVADRINASGVARAIFPFKIKRLCHRGTWREISVPLIPSYVFIYSDTNFRAADLAKEPDVLRVLKYGDDFEGILIGDDRVFANLLWAQGGKIGVLKAMRVGERVEIVDGVFKALKGRVVAMDKRKQAAKVELDVVGSLKNIWLSFDYINESE